MDASIEQLDSWLNEPEDSHLEFKEAKHSFEFDKLAKYCVALSNEGGGKLIFGVTDKRPRRIVGSSAFSELGRTKGSLFKALGFRVEAHEIDYPDGRVVVFNVPPHPSGYPAHYKGQYLMRAGEDLVPMSPDVLQRLFSESLGDFSEGFCPGATIDDLDPIAIERFRELWHRKSGNQAIGEVDPTQLLSDAELVSQGRIRYAALILFATDAALGQYLGQAEVIFEFRNSESALGADQRVELREGLFLFLDKLWNLINVRNQMYRFQSGLFVQEIPAFRESVVREAVLNAICHRDYRSLGSVFIRQYPGRLEFVSPGGFPPGVSAENILSRQLPRNRRLAEALTRCGLVERAGQGVDLMYKETIQEGKLPPDFIGTDANQVSLTLHGEVYDVRFLRFLERIGQEVAVSFTAQDFVVLDLVHREQAVPEWLRPRIRSLRELGIIELQGRGRGVRYNLSRRFYSFVGQPGTYTRKYGLDRETNKTLLLKHVRDNPQRGCKLEELHQVLPHLSRKAVQHLVAELKREGHIIVIGRSNGARWYPAQHQGKGGNGQS